MLAGLNPAQGLIFMLQALGGKLISKDMAMRELPFNVNVTLEQERIETEDMRAALIGSLQAYAQAIPQIAAQGGDPSNIVNKIAEVIRQRQKGISIEDAIGEVFQPENPPAGGEQPVEQPSVPSAPGAPAGGSQQEIQAGPGMVQQRPELQTLLSSLNASGRVGSSVRTSNRRQIG
jgi:hypothetical protein